MRRSVPQIISLVAIAAGLVLFVITMLGIDRTETWIEAQSLGAALPLVLLPSIGWHLLRAAGHEVLLGRALEAMQDPARAREAYLAATAADPHNLMAWDALAGLAREEAEARELSLQVHQFFAAWNDAESRLVDVAEMVGSEALFVRETQTRLVERALELVEEGSPEHCRLVDDAGVEHPLQAKASASLCGSLSAGTCAHSDSSAPRRCWPAAAAPASVAAFTAPTSPRTITVTYPPPTYSLPMRVTFAALTIALIGGGAEFGALAVRPLARSLARVAKAASISLSVVAVRTWS